MRTRATSRNGLQSSRFSFGRDDWVSWKRQSAQLIHPRHTAHHAHRRLNFGPVPTTNPIVPIVPNHWDDWTSMDAWDACADPKQDVEKLKGQDCFLGLDIGATSDFTAAALLFPHDDAEIIELPDDRQEDNPEAPPIRLVRRSYTILPYFWLPKSPVRRSPQLQSVIDAWIARRLIRVTPGNVVDYDYVLKDLIELEERYAIRKIAFDRGFQGAWMGTKLMSHFGEHVVHWFPQGIISMNAPFRELIELVKMKRKPQDHQHRLGGERPLYPE